MAESIISIAIVGLLAGFIFSMPIAGPISILITTNALKGRLKYSILVNVGASLATFTYVFLAVFGLSKLYRLYQPAIPYLFAVGSVLLLFIGYRIFRTKFDFEHLEDKSHINEKIRKKETRGFYTGLVINFLNPTLFVGWLTSTFLVFSFVSSLGLSTGGLNLFVDKGLKEIVVLDPDMAPEVISMSSGSPEIVKISDKEDLLYDSTNTHSNIHLVISIVYALAISVGSVSWFCILALLIIKYRKHINIKILSACVKTLGIVLILFGLYFGYLAAKMIFIFKL
jgi:threonine/homoserine/homoserine lactone efflux protein